MLYLAIQKEYCGIVINRGIFLKPNDALFARYIPCLYINNGIDIFSYRVILVNLRISVIISVNLRINVIIITTDVHVHVYLRSLRRRATPIVSQRMVGPSGIQQRLV